MAVENNVEPQDLVVVVVNRISLKNNLSNLTVGIDGKPGSLRGEQLVDILNKTHLFAEVGFKEELRREPDLVLTYSDPKFEEVFKNTILFFSQFSDYASSYYLFGILPSRAKSNEYSLEFYLESVNGKRKVLIPIGFKLTRVIGGWPFFIPLVLFQQWHLDENKALSNCFKRALINQKNEIFSLLSDN